MTYAARYPDEVAGLVLVDSTAASTNPVPVSKEGSYSFVQHASSLVATTSWLGAARLLAATSFSELPPRYRDDYRATAATGTEMAGVLAEYLVAGGSAAAAGTLRSLDAKPLVVLTASQGNRQGWMDSQNRMAGLSTNSVHRIEPGATHSAFVDDPDHAAAVTRAIHDVVVSLRSGVPLDRH
jgi:pimeloyl-ACP methyl ester carboxylesterase